jgi:formylmethanofuran dehydrogenase subunit B
VAQFVVRACNSHSELIAALRCAMRAPGIHTTDQVNGVPFSTVIETAIANAEGGAS